MAIQEWSDTIRIAELNDDPQFTEDLAMLGDALAESPSHVVLNFSAVGFINSSNVARLLRLRKKMVSIQRRLVLCEVNTQVWGIFQVTGLDKIFDFTKDVSTALAKVQLDRK
jgi:anti-anti-sigma factor